MRRLCLLAEDVNAHQARQSKFLGAECIHSLILPCLRCINMCNYVCTDYRFKHVEAYMHHVYCISTWLNYDLPN